MDFGAALDGLKGALQMRRQAWPVDVSIAIATVDDKRAQVAVHLCGERDQGKFWRPNLSDILADDWQVFTK